MENNTNITSAQYFVDPVTNENAGIKATIEGIPVSVPLDPTNTDYAAILEWVAEGNTIQEAD